MEDFLATESSIIQNPKPFQESTIQKKWDNNSCIIGKIFITDENISFKPAEVIKQIDREWVNLISKCTVLVLDDGCFSFKFENNEDKKWIMGSRPWLMFQNQYVLLLKELCPNVPAPSKIEFTHCPFWIQAHNFPLGVTITESLGFKIGEVSGYQVLKVDLLCGRKRKRNNSLRIRVVVDVTMRLATGFWLCISRNLNEVHWVSYKYEDLPKKLCYRCGVLGHDKDRCANDELAKVPIDEKCIVNYVYDGAVPSRVLVDAKAVEEGETERGYGSWLYEEECYDEEEDSEDEEDEDSVDDDEDEDSEDDEDGVYDGDDESYDVDSDEAGDDELVIDDYSCVTSQSTTSASNTP